MTELNTLRSCLNCGTALQGTFCHNCGQKEQPVKVGVQHLFHDVLHDLLHYDHKLLNTFWLLVSRPGFLVEEYLKGRRVRHLPPFRLYLVTSCIVLFVFSLLPSKAPQVHSGGPQAGVNLVIETGKPGEHQAVASEEAGSEAKAGARNDGKSPQAVEMTRRIMKAIEEPEHFKHVFLSSLSKALFVFMPLFAGLLLLLHLRRRSSFMDTLVISLFHHAFCFIVVLALTGLAYLPGEDWSLVPALLLFCLPPIHLAITLQRLYRRGWLRARFRPEGISTSLIA